MRRPVVAGNWKMNPATAEEAVSLASAADSAAEASPAVDVVVCPPTIWLAAVAGAVGPPVAVGAQTMHFEERGAFTGETSPLMLAGLAAFVIVGHSERRQYFNETNEIVRAKIGAALRFDLKAIVCIGETLREREAENTLPVIERQVREGLVGLSREAVRNLVLAYEPVWAIGTGKTATPEQAEEVHAAIRALLREFAGDNGAEAVRILYGGSVKADNIDALMAQPNIDGALVGGASLDPAAFNRIIAFQ